MHTMNTHTQMEFKKIKLGRLELNKGQIKGLPANPRKWQKADIEALARSMQETPELAEARGAIVIPFQTSFVVLGGNMRVEAARKLAWPDLMCAVLPETTPVEKLKQIVLKDNSSFGAWDVDLLKADWGEFEFMDIGIHVDFPKGTQEPKDDDYDADKAYNKAVKKPITQTGDVIQLGKHRLVCGDSTEAHTFQSLMEGDQADLLITDPPYNVDIEDANIAREQRRHGRSEQKAIENDNLSDGQFRGLLYNAFDAAINVTKPGGVAYIWMASTEIDACIEAFEKAGWLYKQLLIWAKNCIVVGRQDYQWQHEPCIYGWKPGAGHYFTDSRKESTISEMGNKPIEQMSINECRRILKTIFEDNGIATDLLHYPKPSRSAEHPTMKPIPLIGHQIKNSSRQGDIVLNPFGGSGTTLIACEQLGRRCRTVELDPAYCDVIVDRWEKFTGQKAIRP